MKMFSRPTASQISIFAASIVADRQRAVERELHVAGARCLRAGHRNLLRQIGGRNDHSATLTP